MLSMIFYWLLMSFVSAHFSKDAFIHEKDKQNNSKLPAMKMSNSSPVSEDCVLKMKDDEIAQVIQLTKSDLVNIVDLHAFFGDSYNNQLFGDYQISLVNPVGREIIRTLETGFRGFVTWTLNAGRKTVKLRIDKSPKDCAESKELSIHDLASSIYERIFGNMKEPTNYKICYTFSHRRDLGDSFTRRRCKPDDFTTLHWDGSLSVVTYIMFVLFPIYFSWSLFSLLSYSVFNIKHPKYYKLEESLMSPASVLLKIIWEEKGREISFLRRSIIMGCLTFIVWSYIPTPVLLFKYTRYLVFYSTLSIPFSRVFLRPMISSIMERRANRQPVQNTPSLFCDKFGDCVNCLTLPLNLKFWKEVLPCPESESERRQVVQKGLKKIGICFLCVCILFPVLLIIQSLYFLYQTFTILNLLLKLGYKHTDTRPSRKKEELIFLNNGLTTISLLVLVFHILFILVFAIQSFLLGLFLNLNFFIPYLAFASVLTFYCHSYWKSLEEKYLVLKRVIYDACRERQGDIHDGIPSRVPGENEVALPVVSKEVYEIIREKFLPYHTNISYFVLKLLWSFAFSFGIFVLVNMLHAFHITAAVQVITTASVSIMPHVLNMVALKTSEEKEEAWKEKLKLNIKYIMEKLTSAENPEPATTVLIIRDSDDTVAEKIKLLKSCTADNNEANNNEADPAETPVRENRQYESGF